MGTFMSTPLAESRPYFDENDNRSLGKSFQRALYVEAKSQNDSTNSKHELNSRLTHQGSQEILDGISLEDVIEKRGKNKDKVLEKVAPMHTGKAAIRIPSQSDTVICGSAASRANNVIDINKNAMTENNVSSIYSSGHNTKNDSSKRHPQSIVKTGPKPFQPEPWPSLTMIQSQISRHKTGIPSTVVLARFYSGRFSSYVTIRYSVSSDKSESFFESSASLDTLIPFKEGFPKLSDTKEDQTKHFLMIFKACMNNLQGQIWWNGFSIMADQQSMTNRLTVSGLEVHPGQLLYEITNMKNLTEYKTIHCLELRGKVGESAEENLKYIRFRGVAVKDIKVNQPRGNLITVHIPRFSEEYIVY